MFATTATQIDRPTPLLRWGRALLKLELFRAPRVVLEERGPPATGGASRAQHPEESRPFAATGHHALARARHGMAVALRGAVTHEMRKMLELWSAQLVEDGEPWQPDPSALVRELLQEIDDPPALVVAPAGESVALAAVLAALRAKWPGVRGVALLAADVELPDLPLDSDLPEEIVRVTFAQASVARTRLAGTLGLLAGHASAAAAAHAFEHGGLALVTAPGEREFSLEPR